MPMSWVEVENLVVSDVRQRVNTLYEGDPAQFARDFQAAYRSLQRSKYQDPDYALPTISEAYCLKYHLPRMDNLSVALDYTHRAHPLLRSSDARVLDIGGGTGGSTMTVAHWSTANIDLQPKKISITSIEPSAPMRETAQRLIPSLLRSLSEAEPALQPFPIKARMLNYNLEDCAIRCHDSQARTFDLILFSYALWKQLRRDWRNTTGHILDIAKALKPEGVLLFLTPKLPIEKVRFMEHLTGQLTEDGFDRLNVRIGNGRTFAPRKHPKCLHDSLCTINEACGEATGIYPLGKNFGKDADDRPFYGLYGTVQAFTRS